MSSSLSTPHQGRPATAFLSYAHEDTQEVIALQQQFTLRGVHAWRDVTDLALGSYTREEITYAIERNCDVFLLYVTPHALKSQFIWDVEIPAARRRREHDHLFGIIPIFRNVTPAEFQQSCADYGYPDLADFNGTAVPKAGAEENEATIRVALQEVARRTLFAALKLRFRRIQAQQDYEPWICLRNFHYKPSDNLDLDLDWPERFEGRPAGQEEWQQLLQPALQDVKDALSQMTTSRVLHFFVQARLPFAFALGAMFPSTAHFALRIEGRHGTWQSEGTTEAEAVPLRIKKLKKGTGSDAVIEISIARETGQTVTESLAFLGLSYGRRFRFEPVAGVGTDAVKGSAQASAMAYQIGRELRRLRDRLAMPQMHLFAAVPAGLATLIGHQFNALGPITLYHLPENENRYITAWAL